MKNRKLKFAVTALLFIMVLFLHSCGNNSSEVKTEKSGTEQTAEVYQCPMKCEGDKTYDKPGRCPVCNMDLQKVEAES